MGGWWWVTISGVRTITLGQSDGCHDRGADDGLSWTEYSAIIQSHHLAPVCDGFLTVTRDHPFRWQFLPSVSQPLVLLIQSKDN